MEYGELKFGLIDIPPELIIVLGIGPKEKFCGELIDPLKTLKFKEFEFKFLIQPEIAFPKIKESSK